MCIHFLKKTSLFANFPIKSNNEDCTRDMLFNFPYKMGITYGNLKFSYDQGNDSSIQASMCRGHQLVSCCRDLHVIKSSQWCQLWVCKIFLKITNFHFNLQMSLSEKNNYSFFLIKLVAPFSHINVILHLVFLAS